MEKIILDASCGGRMFWFDKKHPNATYIDIRDEEHILCDKRKFVVKPDMVMDFKKLEFPDKSFKLVVFDPPHLTNVGKSSWIVKKYGKLEKNWQEDIKKGFTECMRVLDDYGTLIFKWSCKDIPVNKIIECIGMQPLFGHKTSHTSTWMAFIKLPNEHG